MTVSELCQMLSERGPNREVYVSVHPVSHVVRQNYPVIGIRTEGELLFVDAATEPVEGAGQ